MTGHDLRYAIDSTKLKNELGWELSLQFEEGILKTVKWYLKNNEWLNNVTSGDYHVIVNNDHQRALKCYKEFQQEQERFFIVSNIRPEDHCVLSIDQDRTVCKTIEKISIDFGETYDLSFANGGDQNNNTTPERNICDQMGINLVDGLGDKIQSSSWLLKI